MMFLLIILFVVKLNEVSSDDDKTILIQFEPEQLLHTFQTMMASKYFTSLANEFATKAAQHFIEQIKNKEKEMKEKKKTVDYRSPIAPSKVRVPTILDENRALTLMNEPSPDGDNLDEDNDSELTNNEEEEKQKSPPPAVGGLKINGVYYRRLLGPLSNNKKDKSIILLN